MLLAEDRLDVLIDRFRRLGSGDRRAILRRLNTGERAQILAMVRGHAPAAQHLLPYARDIVERIAAGEADPMMTDAGRAALAKVMARHHPAAPVRPAATASLSDVVARWFRREG